MSALGKEGIGNVALAETEDIYPEGGSGEIDKEINANMVETFDAWVGKNRYWGKTR